MKKIKGLAPVVAAGMLTLAACSTPDIRPVFEPAPIAEKPQVPEAPPPMAVPPVSSSVNLTASRARSAAAPLGYAPAMTAPMPHLARLPQSADKFPDKDANKAVLVSEQPVSTFSVDVDTASYAFVRLAVAACGHRTACGARRRRRPYRHRR